MHALLCLFCVTSFLFTPFLSQAKLKKADDEASSFVLYFHPLNQMPKKQGTAYIQELWNLLNNAPTQELETHLMQVTPTKKCSQGDRGRCEPTLYGHTTCIPKSHRPSQFCSMKSQRPNTQFFAEPVFNRITWNRWALTINKKCNNFQYKVCKPMARLHDLYFKAFQKMNRKPKPKPGNK